MKAAPYRMAGHAVAGHVVDGRTLAAARLAHKLAQRPAAAPDVAPAAPGPWASLARTNAGQALDPAAGWAVRLVAAFRL